MGESESECNFCLFRLYPIASPFTLQAIANRALHFRRRQETKNERLSLSLLFLSQRSRHFSTGGFLCLCKPNAVLVCSSHGAFAPSVIHPTSFIANTQWSRHVIHGTARSCFVCSIAPPPLVPARCLILRERRQESPLSVSPQCSTTQKRQREIL